MKYLTRWLDQNANNEHYLFTLQSLRALLPALSDTAFKTLLKRTVDSGYLTKICRNIYAYKETSFSNGLILFHTAAMLRANTFNYISLETTLSDAGVISQIPINWISIMSSGCSNKISCGEFGTIEFVHTNQKPTDIMNELIYDEKHRLWRASVPLALKNMKATRRNNDLIDWDIANEFI